MYEIIDRSESPTTYSFIRGGGLFGMSLPVGLGLAVVAGLSFIVVTAGFAGVLAGGGCT